MDGFVPFAGASSAPMRRLYPLWWKIGFAPECGLSSRRLEAAANVRLGSKADLTAPKSDFRFTPESRHPAVGLGCPLSADIVAKVFLGWRTKILRAADAFYARRREGPYRFIQNRSRTSVVALKGDAAAEKSKDQLSRDFPGRSIFDFCNNICQQRTSTDTASYCQL